MSRGPYRLRTWLVRAVAEFPAYKSVLRAIARSHGQLEQFESTLRGLLDAGTLVIYGERKNARYGLPGYRKTSTSRRKPHERTRILSGG